MAAMRAKILSNKTVVMVSHNETSLRELCNRVVWIERGAVVEQGAPGAILDRYRERMLLQSHGGPQAVQARPQP